MRFRRLKKLAFFHTVFFFKNIFLQRQDRYLSYEVREVMKGAKKIKKA